MLKNFIVKDYALIEHIEVDFQRGLNIITGETGAGKSILIDALGLLLGERASTEVVRKGANKAYVEGIFEVESNNKVRIFLEENEIEFLPELIMRREISAKGNSRAFVNDSPVNLNTFRELGNFLVDLHGQHEHQSLLRNDTHIDYLDEYAGAQDLLARYKASYSEINKLNQEVKKLEEQESSLKEKKDFLSFQLKEIDAVAPQPGEEEELLNKLKILENSEKLKICASNIYSAIYEGENSIHDQIVKVQSELNELARIDKNVEEIAGECAEAVNIIKDISMFMRTYNSSIDVDGDNLEEMRDRIGALNHLKKKYGRSIEAILEYRDKIETEIDLAENFTENIEKLNKQIEQKRKECGAIAEQLTSLRKKAALSAEKEIIEVLKYLGIEKASFKIKIEQLQAEQISGSYYYKEGKKIKLHNKGADTVDFYISTNPGEDLKPLVKVASGGEVSRIMLSLKTILAKSDKLPLLIFDEIDTGVSGRIAQKIGKVMKDMTVSHQVIAITHLPQIASYADKHFTVEKEAHDERVVSLIRALSEEERIVEIAKLLSGEKITESSLSSAREFLESVKG